MTEALDKFLDPVRNALEGAIDFDGQRLADELTTNTLAAVGVLAFLIGYFTQNIHYMLWTGLGGTALVFLAIVPPWPFFNKHPVSWLPAQTGFGNINIMVDGQKVG